MLLEKSGHIGGSLARFYKNGFPFDVGFHFTGGLQKGGVLYNILSMLGILDQVQPVFFDKNNINYIIFEEDRKRFKHPFGIERIKEKFKGYFPGETTAIDRYFSMVKSVWSRTPLFDLSMDTTNYLPVIDEDFISLDNVLAELTSNHLLKALLSSYAMCYGVMPRDISFASHSRACLSLYESCAYVIGGGDGLIKAFKRKFENFDIDVCCGQHIVELTDINEKMVDRCVLSNGDEISGENIIFTIHPKEISKVLPEKNLSKAFFNRVSSFEPSVGFFAVFATLDSECENHNSPQPITSLFPVNDMNKMLDPAYKGKTALMMIKSDEQLKGKHCKVVQILEPSFFKDVSKWQDSKTGRRPPGYQEYKDERIEDIKDRILKLLPSYKTSFEVVDAASMLTFRDYLNSNVGAAYGIKQKVGQINLLGRIPLRNVYVAGQSSVLPGIIGAMLSSLIIGRSIIGKDQYEKFLNRSS
jgi:phytoene dehydrogenase-like protein